VGLSVVWRVGTRRGLQGSVQLGLPAVVVFRVGTPPELLVFETLGDQMTAIANIDLVSLCDALGVGNPWVKMYEKRYDDFCLPYVRTYPSAKTLRCSSVTGEGIGVL
jgi:hypothetical protein